MDTSLIMTGIFLPDGTKERSVRRVRCEEARDEFYVGGFQEGEMFNVFMVPLVQTSDYFGRNHFVGLILGKSQKDPTKFERVGNFEVRGLTAVNPGEYHEEVLEENEKQEIVMI